MAYAVGRTTGANLTRRTPWSEIREERGTQRFLPVTGGAAVFQQGPLRFRLPVVNITIPADQVFTRRSGQAVGARFVFKLGQR